MSTQNRVIERFRAARRRDDLAVLEGFHAIKHALRFGAELLEIVSADPVAVAELAEALAPDVAPELRERTAQIDEQTLGELSAIRPAGGALALARRPAVDAAALLTSDGPGPVVLLDQPRRLNNVGAAIRVAAAADAEALLTTGDADPWHPEAIRGAAGLQFALPVGRLELANAAIARPIVAIDPGGQPLGSEPLPPGAVLAFGSERHGLTDAVASRAELRVGLPMRKGVSSLNLATAVAAVLYALRPR